MTYHFILHCLACRALRTVLMSEDVLPGALMSRFLQHILLSGSSSRCIPFIISAFITDSLLCIARVTTSKRCQVLAPRVDIFLLGTALKLAWPFSWL